MSTQPSRAAQAATHFSYEPGYTGEFNISPPARSVPHSTTKAPFKVLIVWPSLPGHTTEAVAAGPVDVAVAPEPVVEAAPDEAAPDEAAPDEAAEETTEGPEAIDERDDPPSLAPQIPLFVFGVP